MEDKTQTPAQVDGMTQNTADTSTANVQETAQAPTQSAPERDYPEMTMEDVLASEAQEPQTVNRGDIVDGTVVFVGSEGVAVDIGAKVEGMIPLSQLGEEPFTAEQAQEQFKPGDEILTYVVRVDMANGQIVLSKKRADQNKGWRVLEKMQEEGETFEVTIQEKVRGGLVAQVEGIRAFLPASQVDIRRVNDLDPYVGKPLQVQLIELNRRRNRVIISHRAIMEAQKEEAKQETMEKLEEGAVFEGNVVEITDFGVFVNLGGIDGLVHRSELTYGRFNHPREVVNVGDQVQVQVLDVDEDRERINLSMRALTQDPWEGAMDRYSIGQRVQGKVTNLTNFGAFIELEPGLEGLVHVSEMSWTKRIRHPNEMLTEGEEAEAVILRMDPVDRRISLGIRQTTEDPWSALPDRYPPGTPVKGQVTGLTDFGVFMEIEEGIEGLIHISELDTQRIDNPADLFKKGDEIEAVILNIDPVEQRASLSRRRAMGGGPPIREGQDFVSQGGGRRSDRYSGGGRRQRDYNYSAKEASQGGKISTKLGDVYADLFAQFGMGGDESKAAEENSDKGSEQQDVAGIPGIPDDESPKMSTDEAVELTEGYHADSETQVTE